MSENDGVDETFGAMIRVGVTSAARVGEVLARMVEQDRERAAAASDAAARQLESRLQAEAQVARAAFRGVHDSAWWDAAEPAAIVEAVRAAATWADYDPEACRAYARICVEIRDRYDIGILDVAVGELGPALERAGAELRRGAKVDVAEAAALVAEADAADHRANQEVLNQEVADQEVARLAGVSHGGVNPSNDDAAELEGVSAGWKDRYRAAPSNHDTEVAWDSAERRAATAAERDAYVKRSSDPYAADGVEATMRADLSQAKPPTEAVRSTARTPRARRGRTSASDRQREQGLGR